MSVINEVERKSRFGSKYVASISLLVISILAGTWIGFFLFLPVKSGMSIVDSLEDRFLPRAEGMVLDFTSLSEPSIMLLLMLAGPMTVIPLFLYVRGVELAGLGPAGMIFYITPTFQFLLGFFIYNEQFNINQLVSFILIWIAVFIYLKDIYEKN